MTYQTFGEGERTMSRKLKHKILMLENIPKKKCRYCFSREDLTYDHKFPLILGGTNELKNIQVLCKTCNYLKSKIPDGHFKAIMKYGAQLEQKRAENKIKYKNCKIPPPPTS